MLNGQDELELEREARVRERLAYLRRLERRSRTIIMLTAGALVGGVLTVVLAETGHDVLCTVVAAGTGVCGGLIAGLGLITWEDA